MAEATETGAEGDVESEPDVDVFSSFRQFFALRRDVLVLSLAMFAFSLAFQMTGRYIPKYLEALGAGGVVIGAYGSVGNLIGAVYPYPGGAVSDRVGSRLSLTLFGLASTVGFAVWALAPEVGTVVVGAVAVEPWVWVFAGLFLSQAWKSFGLGATFAIVKQSVPNDRLATGFASTETFRRVGFLVGPAIATVVLALAAAGTFDRQFQPVLLIGAGFALVATVAQHLLYDASEDTIGKSFEGVSQVADDVRSLPEPLRPLLVADTLIRFANGMAYHFFVLVVIDFRSVGLSAFGFELGPGAFFGVLLSVEMVVALAMMIPVSKLAERTGLKPVVALGFLVYAAFPVMLISAPPNAALFLALFAFSGLRFAGLPAHKAMIVGPAEADAGGRVTGSYYLVRNVVVIPSTLAGGVLYAADPTIPFVVASAVGFVGVGYFLAYGKEFAAYA
jgi:MFS family permease